MRYQSKKGRKSTEDAIRFHEEAGHFQPENPNAFGGNIPTAVLTALRFWKARLLREKGDLAAVGGSQRFHDLFGMVSEFR